MTISTLEPTEPTNLEPAGEGANHLREIKLAVYTAFPGVDGEITNTGGTDGPADKIVPDADTFSALFAQVRALEGGTAGVPLGTIIMWSSALNSTIPSGYTICDGSGALNGISVPDLRDRFIIASGTTFADNDTPGGSSTSGTGGAGSGTASFTLDPHLIEEDNLPKHSHLTVSAGESTDTLTSGNAIAGEELVGGSSGPNYQLKGKSTPDTGKTSEYGAASSPVGLTHEETDITINGIEHTHEVVQPYYTLTYLIRVGT